MDKYYDNYPDKDQDLDKGKTQTGTRTITRSRTKTRTISRTRSRTGNWIRSRTSSMFLVPLGGAFLKGSKHNDTVCLVLPAMLYC
jgi:hypothetical protein